MTVLKVSTKSNPNSVAGAIAGLIKEQDKIEINVIGAGALNQAVKSVAIAKGFVASQGIEIVMTPSFTEIVVNGEKTTAMKLIVCKSN